PHVSVKCGSSHRKRPLQKLAAHLNHWSLLAIDQNAIVYRLPAGVDVEYVDRFVAGARCPVTAVHASARRTYAVACMHRIGEPIEVAVGLFLRSEERRVGK